MKYAPEAQAALSGLQDLKRKLLQIDTLDKEITQIHNKMMNLEDNAAAAGYRISKLPENNYQTLKDKLTNLRNQERTDISKNIRLLLLGGILLLAVLGLVMLILCGEPFTGESSENAIPAPVTLMLFVIFSIGMVVFSRVERMSPFDDFMDWLCLQGCAFFIFCWWAPLGAGLIISCMGLATIHPTLLAIPFLMLAFMIASRVLKNNPIQSKTRDFSAAELKQLRDAEDLDARNQRENKRRSQAAVSQAKANIEASAKRMSKEIQDKASRMRALQQEVDNNPYLHKDDLGGIDEIIHLLETGRAESVKEALMQHDVRKNERSRQFAQMEFQRQERERRALADAEAYMNQTFHNMRVEREQRRQTEALERIQRELES